MASAWIEEAGTRVSLRGRHLVVSRRDEADDAAQTIPLCELERITFCESVAVSAPAHRGGGTGLPWSASNTRRHAITSASAQCAPS